jgi:hypothetical protein
MFALILISYAAAFDPADRYSAQLGRATGSGLVLYLAASAVVVIVRGEHKRNP